MYRLAWCAANSADRERLRNLLRIAIVALGFSLYSCISLTVSSARSLTAVCPLIICPHLHYELNLSIESSGTTLDKGNICRQTHLVHMTTGF